LIQFKKKKLKLYIYLIVNNMLLTWNLICALKLMRVYNLKLRFQKYKFIKKILNNGTIIKSFINRM